MARSTCLLLSPSSSSISVLLISERLCDGLGDSSVCVAEVLARTMGCSPLVVGDVAAPDADAGSAASTRVRLSIAPEVRPVGPLATFAARSVRCSLMVPRCCGAHPRPCLSPDATVSAAADDARVVRSLKIQILDW